jgi:hypothetical protein
MTQRKGQTPGLLETWTSRAWREITERGGSSIIASVDRRLVRWGLYRADSRPLGKLQSFLAAWAFVVVALFLLDGAMELWEDGGGRGSLAVAILAWIVWIVWVLSVVVLIGVIWAAAHQWSVSGQGCSVRSGRSGESASQRSKGLLVGAAALLLLAAYALTKGELWPAAGGVVGAVCLLDAYRRDKRDLERGP